MNVNLVSNSDADTIDGHDNVLITDIQNLPNSICQSLIINNTLNALTDEQFVSLFNKIRHGGKITILSVDAMELSGAFYMGKIDIKSFTEQIKNSQNQHTILEVKTLLEQNGYMIETANIQELLFHIKASRP